MSDAFNMDGIHSMGIVNALRTGDMFLDIILAMLIPIIIRTMFETVTGEKLQNLVDKLKLYLFPEEIEVDDYHYRNIKHTVEKNRYDDFNSIDDDSHNEVLIKAISMYLHHLESTFLKEANLRLTSLSRGSSNDYYYSDDSDEEDNTYATTLSGYSIVKNPPSGEWHVVGKKYLGKDPHRHSLAPEKVGLDIKKEPSKDRNGKPFVKPADGMHDVQFMFGESEHQTQEDEGEEEDGQKSNKSKIIKERRESTYQLRSIGEHSVDAFIKEAYEWYVAEIRRSEKDTTRYMYDMKTAEISMDTEDKTHTFKKYRLSDEKTFDSLFFKEKKTTVKLFRHFLDKTGKYGIKGYPQKLGLLLHGPPGTGKTSLIKAVAEYTGRHIVNIPLGRIKTNEELTQLFFSGQFKVEGQYYPQKLGFKDVIFVMEDVDAASKVVQRRDGKKTAEVTQTQHVDLPMPKSMWQMLLESNNDECKELVEKLMEKSKRLKEKALASETMHSLAKRMTSIPGMRLVGHLHSNGDLMDLTTNTAESNAIKKISEGAIETGKKIMENCSSLDGYLEFHARSMKKMLEVGAEVSEEFENELLGLSSECPGKQTIMTSHHISRDVSVSKYEDDRLEMEMEDPITLMDLTSPNSNRVSSPLGEGVMHMRALGGFGNEFGGSGRSLCVGGGKDDDSGFAKFGSVKNKFGGFGGFGGFGSSVNRDALNLSGLLNVLDGVVDTPGRILIMTSNHPEKLDPALIRPGRIDKKLMLGYMSGDDVCELLEHYFQIALEASQKSRVRHAIKGDQLLNMPALNLTPAQVEQLTAEHDEIEDMITALEEKGSPLATLPSEEKAVKFVTDDYWKPGQGLNFNSGNSMASMSSQRSNITKIAFG